jgi:hypothetical protein
MEETHKNNEKNVMNQKMTNKMIAGVLEIDKECQKTRSPKSGCYMKRTIWLSLWFQLGNF